jgi:C4-dicarboxylate transporter DctQ subunit
MLKIIDRLISLINKNIAVIGIGGGVILAFINVIARYIFDASITWAAELTAYLFLWSVFFGAAYSFKIDAHIKVDILLAKLPPKIAKALDIIAHIITAIFLFAISYYGYEYVVFVNELEEISIDLEAPMWIIYLVIPISFALAGIRVLEKIYFILKTPANQIVRQSESEMILSEMGESEKILKD